MPTYPEPHTAVDLTTRWLELLSFYRETLLARLVGLSDDQLTASVVPTGWTPVGLVHHVARVERRWISWGFLAEPVDDRWADDAGGHDGSAGWRDPDVPAGRLVDELRRLLDEAAGVTERVVATHALSERAAVGGRFADESAAPTLGAILLHLLQEYARHAGHLDVARELIDGRVGEDLG